MSDPANMSPAEQDAKEGNPMTEPAESTGGDLRAALRARYTDAEGYAVLSEVRDSTGNTGGTRRYADFVAVSTWPSRGLEIHGFELKTDRGDWLRELKEPAKAEKIFRFCDRWSLVSWKGVAKMGEIPTPWGWIECEAKDGVKMRTMKAAPLNEAPEPPRKFLASLLRSLSHEVGEVRMQEACATAVRQALAADAAKRAKERIMEAKSASSLTHDERALLLAAQEFQRRSGIRIGGAHVAEDVKTAMEFAARFDRENWQSVKDAIEHDVRAGIAVLRSIRAVAKMNGRGE